MQQVLGAVLITVGVILFVLRPILQGDQAPLTSPDGDQDELDAQKKNSALKGLRDAQYDYYSGKLDEEDFQSLKQEMASEVLGAMRRIGNQSNYEIETEIRAVRKGLDAGLTCLLCGEVNSEGSNFCGQCGSQLK
jgi:hypothetical protein